MKVVYQTCCGVDVHKSFLVATIIKTTFGVQPSYQKKRFSTFNNSILEFKKWLLDNSCRDICMESTGKYWVPVFNLLEDEINVTIANPKWVKAVKGNKDDTKDSKWIGDLFRLGLVPGSYIPCKPIRILREFTRYRYKLTSCRSSEKNRFQNALTVCNHRHDHGGQRSSLPAFRSQRHNSKTTNLDNAIVHFHSLRGVLCPFLWKSISRKAVYVGSSIVVK